MDLPRLHGIVPPLPTPLLSDESIDTASLKKLIDFQLKAGVHGLWVLGTTSRFDLLTEDRMRVVGETAAEAAAGRAPLVLNISDMGTKRTLARAKLFQDLPYDYYAVLPPWYQPMTHDEVTDFFVALADQCDKPVVIYNAPWICNQLTFAHLRKLAEHPRIVGCKDVTPALNRTLDWPVAERRQMDFTYLHGTDQLATSAELKSDGFVSALSNGFPEIAVAVWDAVVAEDMDRAFRIQSQFLKIARATGFGPMHACLEVMFRHRGLLQSMLPAPLRSLDADVARRVIEVVEAEGVLPVLEPSAV